MTSYIKKSSNQEIQKIMFHLLRCAESFLHFEHILLAFLKNDSAHRRRWTIIFSISWFDDFFVYDVIPRGPDNWECILVTQMRINVFFKFWIRIGSKILKNFSYETTAIWAWWSWVQKSGPGGINAIFKAFLISKLKIWIITPVSRKKFYCCFFF